MNTLSLVPMGALAAALAGCVAYPVYQQPVARLTPAQSAVLAQRPLDPAERDRLAKLNAEVQREDEADIQAQRQAYSQPYGYAYPAPYTYGYYGYPAYGYPVYGYPYYGGYYPWGPGVSLSFGYVYHRGWGGIAAVGGTAAAGAAAGIADSPWV